MNYKKKLNFKIMPKDCFILMSLSEKKIPGYFSKKRFDFAPFDEIFRA